MPTFQKILQRIDSAIKEFNKNIPASQQAMLDGVEEELRRLDLKDGKIKTTVANLKIVASIKNKLRGIILNDDYVAQLKGFIQAFRDVTLLQNEYWKQVETTFKPTRILKQIKEQAIQTTIQKLGEAGIGANIQQPIADILNQNITTGGSMKDMRLQLRESIIGAKGSLGVLSRYTTQITNDSIRQYSATYNHTIASDLGFEWYSYLGSDIITTRPFCDAMTDLVYFHVSEIPRLLRAEGLYYTKEGKKTKVPLNPKTNLPGGAIAGTNAENFFIRRGGYNCGHQIVPVSERLVPEARKQEVFKTNAYKLWKK